MIDLHSSFIVILFSGVCIFLYGMSVASRSLENILSARVSILLNKVSQNNFMAIVIGISLTTLLQSSGAVTSMLVNLGSAKVVSLPQVMGVIIGTAIGSTLTVQLISFDLSQFALPLFILAFGVYFFSKRTGVKTIALAFIGFAFILLGMGLISSAAHHFAENALLQEAIQNMKANPYQSLLVSMLFCALVQSSAVTVGLVMTLVQAQILTLQDAMFWVYGANIGTTSIALIAAIGSNHIGRQVAWAHFFYKTLSVAMFLIGSIHEHFILLLQTLNSTASRQIANGHLIFNLISAVVFFPFIKPAARFIEKLFPKDPKEDFRAKYLALNNYQSSALATSYANREIMRMADIVLSMINDSLLLFDHADPSLIESIKDRDNKVDFLYRETKMFLIDQANNSPNGVNQTVMQLIMFVTDLERAADAIDINLTTLAIKKNALKLEFSQEGWEDLKEMHAQMVRVAQMGIHAFSQRQLCREAIQLKRELAKLEIQFRENHISRLNRGMRESINTSSIHLDLLSEYKRIASLVCSHAYTNGTAE